MALKDAFLAEFDPEMANTRKTLERVPEGKFTWKPHDKSGTMIWLAQHVAHLPEWAWYTLQQDSLDLAPKGVSPQPPPPPASVKELLSLFDGCVAKGRSAIAGAGDAEFGKIWTLLKNGQQLMAMPKAACLRMFVMNHLIHHRAQLGVYLRLNNVPVPALYGPSADEGSF